MTRRRRKSPRLYLQNETQYDSRQLRAVITRVLRVVRKVEPGFTWSTRWTVVWTRQHRSCSGVATLGGARARLRLLRTGVSLYELSSLVYHEAMHLAGYHHGQFSYDWPPHLWEDFQALWSGPVTFVPKQIQSKPKPSKQERRVDHLERLRKRLRAWETKKKRAVTFIQTLERKIRYYERLQERGE